MSVSVIRNSHVMEATAKIQVKQDGDKTEVSAILPVWHRSGADGKIYASIPLLGMETYANTLEDLEIAVNEAVKCFFIIAEKHGKGLEKELKLLGWKSETTRKRDHVKLWDIPSHTPIWENIINTGHSQAFRLQVV